MYNTNNYGYNPYGTYMPPRPMPQPIQPTQPTIQQEAFNPTQRPVISGKMITDLEMAKIAEYPLDGSVSYFPLTDGSAIVTKQLQMDGTSKIVIYKPSIEEKKETAKYLTADDLEDKLKDLDFSEIDKLKDEIKSLKQEIKELKDKKKGDK